MTGSAGANKGAIPMRKNRIAAALLLVCLLTGLCLPMAYAADTGAPGYVISGSSSGSAYTLNIYARNIHAWTGRIGLEFDTSKVALQGGDSLAAFQMGSGAEAVPEVKPESNMVSASGGFACLAWYRNYGLNALTSEALVATLRFELKVPASEVDASTFRLRCIDTGDFGEWKAAASMQGRGEVAPISYVYLADTDELTVSFTYEGSERVPANGRPVRFECRNIKNEIIAGAALTLNGRSYTSDSEGNITLTLAEGEYLYRAAYPGYGDVQDKLVVRGEESVPLVFVNDADLVANAAEKLTIGYQKGDSAEHVTGGLYLTKRTDDGIDVSWQSSTPSVVTADGLVYLPDSKGQEVVLTAELSRGSAHETREFTVYVCSKAELSTGVAPEKVRFTDLVGYDWAKAEIEQMAAAGIITGRTKTTFAPGENIKRGDFVLLLMRMLDVVGTPKVAFDDVPESSYYFTAIAQARTLGLVGGTGDNLFKPETPITRQEMFTLVMRALEKTGYLPTTDARSDLSVFSDYGQVAGYARDSIAAAVAQGLIVGAQGRLNPLGNTTRAEAAVFIARIYNAHNT